MHILYLSAAGGGHETNVRVLAPALIDQGHQVSILYLHPASESHTNGREQNGISVYHANYGDWHYYFSRLTLGVTRLPLLLRSLESARALKDKVNEIHQQRPVDIVELPEVGLPGNGFPVPYVVRLHSSAWMCRRVFDEPSPWTDSVEANLEARTLRHAASVTSPSNFVASYIRAQCRLPETSIQIIPYPVDTDEFKPAAKDRRRKSVLFVGRVENRKGADVLLRAIPLVRRKHGDCEFLFVGKISDELADMVKQAPAAARFLSFKPRHELVEFYQQASVCVVPSLWDNSPNVIYESMACGTPVVATRVGGIPELIEDGITGVLVPSRDEQSLADAISAMLDDPDRQRRMSQRAREKALSDWTVDAILARTLQTYESVIASS